jgi:hypothetical protein
VINVVVLQNPMDMLKCELGSCSETSEMSTCEGNEVRSIKVERVTGIKEEEEQDTMTIPIIKMEAKVSCMPVVSVMHISYMLYRQLPVPTSVFPCETKI